MNLVLRAVSFRHGAAAPRSERSRRLEHTFTRIYQERAWQEPGSDSVSGRGSTLERTVEIRKRLPGILAALGARSLLDAACGDFHWMRRVDLGGVHYIGIDIVAELVERNRALYGSPEREFRAADLTSDALPRCDAILCRDTLIHLSSQDGWRALHNFRRSAARHLLLTNHISIARNEEVASGGWRNVNLHLPPFSFPAPLVRLVENAVNGKTLDSWEMGSLEAAIRRAGAPEPPSP